MRSTILISQFVYSLASIFLCPAVQGAGYAPQVGQRHADFTLPEIRSGKPISLSDYRGKRVLLVQFASW